MARKLKYQAGGDLGLIVIDYLQLLRSHRRIDNRVQEVSEISRSLKELARELGVPVIALSQLSRSPEQRPGQNPPKLSDLRESGSLEQDSDVVIFIHRSRDDNQGAPSNEASIVIAKHRNGPLGVVNLYFDQESVCFGTNANLEEIAY